jgi:hypothetical protein
MGDTVDRRFRRPNKYKRHASVYFLELHATKENSQLLAYHPRNKQQHFASVTMKFLAILSLAVALAAAQSKKCIDQARNMKPVCAVRTSAG